MENGDFEGNQKTCWGFLKKCKLSSRIPGIPLIDLGSPKGNIWFIKH